MVSRIDKRNKKKSWVKRVLSIVLILVGMSLILYPNYTDIYYRYNQLKMRSVAEAEKTDILPDELTQDQYENDYVMRLLARDEKENYLTETEDFLESDYLFILKIPKIDLDTLVLGGTTPDILKKATGFYTMSAFPGEGNTAIAGHRNTYGHPFRKVNYLEQGDEIFLYYRNEKFVYVVQKVFVIANNDWSVIDPTEKPSLTLTTCHPIGTSDQRMVVRALLDRIEKQT